CCAAAVDARAPRLRPIRLLAASPAAQGEQSTPPPGVLAGPGPVVIVAPCGESEHRSIARVRRSLAGEPGNQDAESTNETPDGDPASPGGEGQAERRRQHDDEGVADANPTQRGRHGGGARPAPGVGKDGQGAFGRTATAGYLWRKSLLRRPHRALKAQLRARLAA